MRIVSAAKKGTTLELLVYGPIGANWFTDGITSAGVAAAMKSAGSFDSLTVRINSPGGDVFEGVAIANLLRAQCKPVAVVVDGVAASAGSVVAMAGDTISMGQGAMMMIHNASTMASGQASAFRSIADTLDKVSAAIAETYVNKSGKSMAEVLCMMDAETWMSADDAVREGFATDIVPVSAEDRKKNLALAAELTKHFQNAPVFESDPAAEGPFPVAGWEDQIAFYRRRLELVGQ